MNELTKGDLIGVYHERQVGRFPQSRWIQALVVDVSADGAILARARRGTFNDSHDHIILELRHRGKTWR